MNRVTSGIFLTDEEALILYQRLRLGSLRADLRGRDDRLYDIVNGITVAAFSTNPADPGTQPLPFTAEENARWWTVAQVSRASRIPERTVRDDCQHQLLPAAKPHGAWLIPDKHARAYIAGRRKN